MDSLQVIFVGSNIPCFCLILIIHLTYSGVEPWQAWNSTGFQLPTPWSIPPPPPILQPSSGSDQDVGLHAEGTSTSGSYNPVKSELSASTSEGSNTYGVEYITSAGYVPHNTVASNFAGLRWSLVTRMHTGSFRRNRLSMRHPESLWLTPPLGHGSGW